MIFYFMSPPIRPIEVPTPPIYLDSEMDMDNTLLFVDPVAEGNGLEAKRLFLTSPSEQEVSMFLDYGPPATGDLYQPCTCQMLYLSSGSLGGSLVAGSAGIAGTQPALSNRESTHQAPGRRDQVFGSSRGLVSVLPV